MYKFAQTQNICCLMVDRFDPW